MRNLIDTPLSDYDRGYVAGRKSMGALVHIEEPRRFPPEWVNPPLHEPQLLEACRIGLGYMTAHEDPYLQIDEDRLEQKLTVVRAAIAATERSKQ